MSDQTRKEEKKLFRELIKKIRKDPHAGLGEFYEIYGRLILTAAQTVCHSAAKSEEVVNDVLLKVWKNASKLRKVEQPENWIFAVTVNTAKDRRKEEAVCPLEEEVVAAKDVIEEYEQLQDFCADIQNLSEKEQQIIIYKFIMRETFQEIAEKLNDPLSTVTSVYYRALKKIKKNLENFEEDA